MQVTKEKVVGIDYTLKDEQGQLLDTSRDREPLYYLHGVGNIIPGLENALEGKATGDQVEVVVPPTEGYGERDEKLVQAVARDNFADVDDVEVGQRFRVRNETGEAVVTVVGVEDDRVTLDGNHQLAGVTLHFDVTVRDVRDATAEEISHGHVHGPGGESH